jgi:phenylacetic acid degradation protein PaaD
VRVRQDPLSPDAAQARAQGQADAMLASDTASRSLGMQVTGVSPGRATVTMTVTAAMVNGHGICHGGYVFLLADSAFAFACNTHGVPVVASGADVSFLAPVREGDVLVAHGVERVLRGRSGLYDVTVLRDDEPVAEFRGRSRALPPPRPAPTAGPRPDRRRQSCVTSPPTRAASTRSRPPPATRSPPCSWSGCAGACSTPRPRPALPVGVRRGGRLPRRPARARRPAHFPFTTKADLRANYPFGMFAVPQEQVSRIHASSGTTGQPTVVGYTSHDVRTWAHVVARSIRAAGGRPGMKVHVAYGYGLFTGGLGAHYGAERLGCTVIPVSGRADARQVRLITDFRPTSSW